MKLHDYVFDKKYEKSVAYFSMEFAIHQALKIYSGGLGFLAGSHMRSAYELKQNIVGIGILWSYGYYDQARSEDRSLKVEFIRKYYSFLEDLGILARVNVHGKEVHVKAFYLKPATFHSAPLILLSTDIQENDFLSRTITQKLYDANEETRISQEIVLGIGGVRVLEALKHKVDIYHLNEGHALPLVYELYAKSSSIEKVKEAVRFTTHTPEDAGNEQHELELLHKFGFFSTLALETIQKLSGCNTKKFNLTLGALCAVKRTNAVSKMHGEVANRMWAPYTQASEIISITNAQSKTFWMDKPLLHALEKRSNKGLVERKKHLKRQLFNIVADQTGKMFDEDVLTLVWARRFAEYKRPDLIKKDFERFLKMLENSEYPVQIIWAGKPYPFDFHAVNMFNELIHISHKVKNMAVLIGYELDLSRALKCGADVWLNTPRVSREASGTSGMSGAMNAALHLSTNDGWHREFAKDGVNSFTIKEQDKSYPKEELDAIDNQSMMELLENKVIPTYYKHPNKWIQMMKHSMQDAIDGFDSIRMADEYYEKMYKN
ncbi:MAG: alpha-glucan family phosphorylase [Campylobacterales bacterium]|nr:alpha-glucan family phosphorylase [Campylobacterales bacterium]